MTTEIAKIEDATIVEQVVLHGDLAELSPKDRVNYYARVCQSLGLNPFTRPFEFIKLNNKLTLYARRDATDQLRAIKNVSIEITKRETIDGVYVVTAKATCAGRSDESTGAVDIGNLKGDFKANAMMKAETKAKRRVTLSIVGLGWLDETEVTDIPKGDAEKVDIDMTTGEIKKASPGVPKSSPEIKDTTPAPQTPQQETPKAESKVEGIDLPAVKDMLAKIGWSKGKTPAWKSWLSSKANYADMSVEGTLEEVLGRMDEAQKKFFVDEAQKRSEMA